MPGFLVFGAVFTLLTSGAAIFAWWRIGRNSVGGTRQPRDRTEARRVQARFDEDEDFASNFHRPTQNEVLETLQMLDHLAPAWDQGEASLAEHRLKNELAESFPSLRKQGCGYPQTVAGEAALLSGGARVPSATLRASGHQAVLTRRRAEFRDARAQANALHQLTTRQEIGPDEPEPAAPADPAPSRPARVAMLLGASALTVALALLVWYVAPAVLTRSARKIPLSSVAETRAGINPPRPANAGTVVPAPAANLAPPPAAQVEPVDGTPAPLGPPTESSAGAGVTGDVTVPVPTPEAVDASVQASLQPPVVPAPKQAAAVPPPPPSPEGSLAQHVAESKLRAVDRHPDLMVPNSEINLRFVFRYKTLLTEKSPRLQDPRWPEELADECAEAAGTEAKRKKSPGTS